MNIDPMYQYSLKFFENIYRQALNNGEHIDKSKKNDRKFFFIKEFTRLLYENICRSLFEKDKLLFSFLMCIKIMDEDKDKGLDPREVTFLLTGGTSIDMPKPNPSGKGGWMSDKIWASIIQLSEEFECFKGLDDSFVEKGKVWEGIYNSVKPQSKKAGWPAPFDELTVMRKAAVLRVLRPDKVLAMI